MKAAATHSAEAVFREASRFLVQERKSFAETQKRGGLLKMVLGEKAISPTQLNSRFADSLRRSLRVHAERNELGLYRNCSLTLAYLALESNDQATAADHLLDVTFLDVNGAMNSLPGHASFDGKTGGLVDFVTSLLTAVISASGFSPASTETAFKERWKTFGRFSSPPQNPERAWAKVAKKIRI